MHHLGVVAQGASKLESAPVNIRQLKITGKNGAVISQIEKDGHLYMAILNKDYKRDMRVDLSTLNNLPRHLTKSLKEEQMESFYIVLPGDVLLFKLR